MDGLLELSREHCLVETPGHCIFILLTPKGGPVLSGSPFCLGLPHQARMLSPLPEVHVPGDPGPYLPGPADANVSVRTTWAKKSGLSEFQLNEITPRHSAARIAVKRRPNAPKGVVYQLADCAASWRQQRCHVASSAIPLSRCDPSL